MRSSYRLILVVTGVSLALQGTSHAQEWQGRRATTTRTRRQTPAASSRQRRDVSTNQTGGDEKIVLQRVHGYQYQLQREEKLLSQRMAQAERLRQRGLAQKDQHLLDQAERYERRSLAAYQQRVRQFEKYDFNAAGSRANSSSTRRGTTSGSRARSSQYRTRRSTRRTSPQWRWPWSSWR